MSRKVLFIPTVLVVLVFMLSSSTRNPNNPPTGNTGAPGETTCQRSGCHGGGSYVGTVTVTGVPDTVEANTTYPITIKNTSNAVRAGFQLTCLTSTGTGCGTITAATGVSVATSGGKQYARQSTPKSLSGGSASWTFNWKSPATLANPQIRFYYSMLCANGNGNDSGDNVLVGADTVSLRTIVSSSSEPISPVWFTHSIDQSAKQLRISLLDASRGSLQLFHLNGQLMLDETLSSDQVISTATLKSGIYIANISAGGRSESVKLFIGN